MRYLLIALTFSASAALAQTTGSIVLTGPANETTFRFKKEPCNQTKTVNWTVNTTSTICGDLEFWFVAGTSCPETRASETPQYTKIAQSTLATTRTSSFTFEAQDLPTFNGTNAVACPADGQEIEYRICAAMKVDSGFGTCGTTSTHKASDFEVFYDAKPPDPPSIDNVAPLDKALSVRISAPEDASEVKLTVKRDGTVVRTIPQSVEQPLFRVENLENDVKYTLTATALDEAANESAASDETTGTPIFTRGFFDRYVEAGGQEMGGCGAALGGLSGGWVLAVLGFWLSSRRNRS